jgi:hypothetical protein
MLSGDLTGFPLRDLLHLLASTGKSGQLTLHGTGGAGGVFLRDGGICFALLDITRVALGPRLIRTGNADREAVVTAARAADGTAFGLTCGLVRAADDAAAAATIITDHTREAIGWLSQYFAATFEFDPTVAVDAWPFPPFTAAQVLADVERDAPQWADLRAVVEDLSLVPSCLPEPPPDALPLQLTGVQWRLIALIDEQRTTKELVELAGLGYLEVGRELAGLVRDGCVELIRPGAMSAVDVLLADVHTIDAYAISPPWMARDDDVPPRIVTAAGDGDAGEPLTAGMADDVPAEPAPEPAPSQLETPLSRHEDDVTPDTTESAPDANVGLLNRLVGRARSS